MRKMNGGNNLMKNLFDFNAILPLVIIAGFIGSIGIEISPIKINPWSWIFKQISSLMNKDVNEKLDNIGKFRDEQYKEMTDDLKETLDQLHKLNKRVDENEMQRIRWEILDFANSIKNHRLHSEDEFFHIIEMNVKYHQIIEYRKLQNGVIDIEVEFIMNEYRRCRDENDFL